MTNSRSLTSGAARLATGTLMSMPRCIIGVATMKMISSTSMTSTSGTTLISASWVVTRRPRPRRGPCWVSSDSTLAIAPPVS